MRFFCLVPSCSKNRARYLNLERQGDIPFLRTESREGLPAFEPLELLDWSNPDLLIDILKNQKAMMPYLGPEWALADKIGTILGGFQKRVKKAKGRFRHPSCRAVHSLLAWGRYDNVGAMSLCGSYGGNANPRAKKNKDGLSCGFCSRRRFCASCAW